MTYLLPIKKLCSLWIVVVVEVVRPVESVVTKYGILDIALSVTKYPKPELSGVLSAEHHSITCRVSLDSVLLHYLGGNTAYFLCLSTASFPS